MENPAAVALGQRRSAKQRKKIGKKGVSDYMSDTE
jgi:hypothetical protein